MGLLPVIVNNGQPALDRCADALRDVGAVSVVVGPAYGQSVQDTYTDWHDFFEKGPRDKYTANSSGLDGLFPYACETAKGASAPDPKEFYHYFAWGRCPPDIQQRTRTVFAPLADLAAGIIAAVGRQVTKRPGFARLKRDVVENCPNLVLRITRYIGPRSEVQFLNSVHHDINYLTLLPAATGPGLQIQTRDRTWVDVAPRWSCVTVLCGDMLAEATRGEFIATPHRVLARRYGLGSGRMSLSFFANPSSSTRLSPRHTASSYLKERLAEVGLSAYSANP